jgi:hypothetical protein
LPAPAVRALDGSAVGEAGEAWRARTTLAGGA